MVTHFRIYSVFFSSFSRFLIAITTLAAALLLSGSSASAADRSAAKTINGIANGTNVIVMLNSPTAWDQPESFIANTAQSIDLHQRYQDDLSRATQARTALLAALNGYSAKVYAGTNWLIPAVALTVDPAALAVLKASPLVQSVTPDGQFTLEDSGSDAQIGAPAMWNAIAPDGYTGSNETVAILDTGVQEDHPFFTTDGTTATSRILTSDEACYSGGGNRNYSLCPGGGISVTGAGAAAPCAFTRCDHGTHAAGIAAGYGNYSGGIGYSGVAIGASILPMQVFSVDTAGTDIVGYFSDVLSGLNQVATLAENNPSLHIAAVNLSLGAAFTDFSSTCDHYYPAFTNGVHLLQSLGIPTVIAAGDDGLTDGIDFPACVSGAISVGAVDQADAIYNEGSAGGTDSGTPMTLFAPGVNINSALPNGAYGVKSGTSAAAAQVTGAIALLRQENPSLTISQLTGLLTNTGRLIHNASNGLTQPRLQVDVAGLVALSRPATIGIYRQNIFYLKNANSTGFANAVIPFGTGNDALPIAGDWTSGSFDQIGVFNQGSATFTLCTPNTGKNTQCSGTPANLVIRFGFGNGGDTPIAARWTPRGQYTVNSTVLLSTYPPDGVGVFRPSNGLLFMKNTLATGFADFSMILGLPGDSGIAGDWDLDGEGSAGVYRPAHSVFYLSNQVVNGSVYADVTFTYGSGATGDVPVIGSWLGQPNPAPGAGVYRTTTGFFMLRNTLTTGFADNAFFYGQSTDQPVVGDWAYSSGFYRPPARPRASVLPPAILIGKPDRSASPQNAASPGDRTLGD